MYAEFQAGQMARFDRRQSNSSRHNFLTRIARTVAMTLLPVAFITFVTLPASLHHHIGTPANGLELAPQHMT